MLDRSLALQILGLREGADENEAAAAYRSLRRHVEARSRAASDDEQRVARADELRELERAWRALSSLPTPQGIVQDSRPPRALGLAPRWLLAWAVVATASAAVLVVLLARPQVVGFGPRVLVDAAGGGGAGGPGGEVGYAIAGSAGAEDGTGGGGDGEALDAGPRTELVARSSVEGAGLRVFTRGEARELTAEGPADETSYWLAPGSYTVEVEHPDCGDTWQRDVEVEEGQPRLTVDPELCRNTGWMVVRSNVDGDELSIDGEKVGATGEEKHPVTPGEHEVRVDKRGYQSWEGIVEVEPGQVLGIRPRLVVAKAQKRPKKPQPEAPGPAPEPAPETRAATSSSEEPQERREGVLKGRWHEDARRWLLARYDYDRSGLIDTREEVEAVPCDHWLGLEHSHDQSGLGLTLIKMYGFDGDQWVSGALGVADETRDLTHRRMQSCGLR